MLIDKEIVCPHCQQATKIGTASPDSTGKYTTKGAVSTCRKCGKKIISVTLEDGTLVIVDPDKAAPGPAND